MSVLKVTDDYQITIPPDLRDSIKPGMEFDVIVKFGQPHLVLIRPLHELRGFAKGIDTTIEKEPDRY